MAQKKSCGEKKGQRRFPENKKNCGEKEKNQGLDIGSRY
jgi:hypothetical protein